MNIKLLLINNHNLFEMFAKCKNCNGKVLKSIGYFRFKTAVKRLKLHNNEIVLKKETYI